MPTEIQPLISFLRDGGVIAWTLLAVLLTAVLLAASRAWALYLSRDLGGRIRDHRFVDRLVHLIRNGHGRETIRRYGETGGMLTRIAADVVAHRNDDPIQILGAAEAAVLDETARIESGIRYLPLLARVAVLLSLLGGIFALGDADRAAAVLPQGVGIDLPAPGDPLAVVALGLLIALTIYVMHTVLEGRAEVVRRSARSFAIRAVDAVIDTLPEEPTAPLRRRPPVSARN